MDEPTRYSSSVYSDSFQLDDLLQKLSEQAFVQNAQICRILEAENKDLRNKLSQVQQVWCYIYKLMQEVNSVAGQLDTVQGEGYRLIDHQKIQWIVNCTEF